PHSDEVAAKYGLEVAAHPGGKRPVTRWDQPGEPTADAMGIEEKVAEEDQCQDAAEEAGNADRHQLEDAAVLGHPGLRLARDHGTDPRGIQLLTHQVQPAVADQNAHEGGDRPLQIAEDPLQL